MKPSTTLKYCTSIILYCGFLAIPGILSWLLYLNLLNPFTWEARLLHAGLTLMLLFLAVLLPGWVRFRTMNAISVPHKLFLYVLSVCWVGWCILLGFEAFFRVFPIYDSVAVNPGVQYVRPGRPWNRFGHKDREFSLYHSPTKFRILTVGDSYTEGVGVTLSETFSAVLERQLQTRIQRLYPALSVEVFNLGHSGRNTEQEVQLILRDSPLLTPDFIVLAYVLNDAEQHPDPLMQAATPPWLQWRSFNEFFFNQVRSYAYYWLFKRSSRFIDATDVYSAQHHPSYEGWKKVENSLNTYHDYLDSTHVANLAIIFPMFIPGDYPQQCHAIHKQVIQAFKQRGLPVMDLLPMFQSQNAPLERFCLSSDDGHPNKEAHALIGNLLADVIFCSPAFHKFITLNTKIGTGIQGKGRIERALGSDYGKGVEAAFAFIRSRDYTKALEHLDAVIDMFEQTVIPLDRPYISVWTHEEYDDYVKENQRKKTLWIDGTYKEAYLLKVQIAIEFQEFERALKFLDKVLSVSPYDSIAYGLRGSILYNMNRMPEALYAYQHAHKFSMRYTYQEANRAAILSHMGDVYRKLGDLTRAWLAYDEALAYRKK